MRRLVTWRGELRPQGGAEDTEDRVVWLHTEMCNQGEVTSGAEGHDVERVIRLRTDVDKHDVSYGEARQRQSSAQCAPHHSWRKALP